MLFYVTIDNILLRLSAEGSKQRREKYGQKSDSGLKVIREGHGKNLFLWEEESRRGNKTVFLSNVKENNHFILVKDIQESESMQINNNNNNNNDDWQWRLVYLG